MGSPNKVGIIIPAYNVEPYIFRAMDSCINQSYENIEIIVVDDGSTDDTYDVVRAYADKDSRVKLCRQENAGVSSARNRGLELCEADYVIFLDSDDWLEPDAVARFVQHLEGLEAGPALIAAVHYNVNHCENGLQKSFEYGNTREAHISADDALMYTGSGLYLLQSCCFKLFSMAVINEHALQFSTDLKHGEDGLFVFEYLKHAEQFIYFPEALWNVYTRPGSATRLPFSRDKLSAIRAVERMLSHDNPKALQDQLNVFLVRRAQWLLAEALMYKSTPKEDIRQLRRLLISRFPIYMRKQKNLKIKLLYLLVTFGPRSVTAKIYKRKVNT